MGIASAHRFQRIAVRRTGLELSAANLAALANLRASRDVIPALDLDVLPAWTPSTKRWPVRQWLQDAAILGGLALLALGILAWSNGGGDATSRIPRGPQDPMEETKVAARASDPIPGALRGSPSQDGSTPAPPLSWVDIAKPFQMYDLPAPVLAKLPTLYSARRREVMASRVDTLTFGQWADAKPWLQVSIARLAALDPESSTMVKGKSGRSAFYLAATRTAARSGLAVTHLSQPTALPTRFGTMDVADVMLSRGTSAPQACTAFHVAADTLMFEISGLACKGNTPRTAAVLSGPQVVCTLDRLNLASAGDDRALAAYFAQSEIKRGMGCTPGKLAKPASTVQPKRNTAT